MVLLNNEPINFSNFPDGTLKINLTEDNILSDEEYVIEWRYENDAEFMLLAFVKMHLDDCYYTKQRPKKLKMMYVPNARMDRTNSLDEVFTLKHFCKLINNLHFDEVMVLDPHSRVAEALIDNVNIELADSYINYAMNSIADYEEIEPEDVVLFFPDEGAQKRYKSENLVDNVAFFGNKVRDWKSGRILGLNIETHTDKALDYLKDKIVLIIDDIICAGGTVYYSLKELEKYGVKKAYAYCSHLENTMFNEKDNKLCAMLDDPNSILEEIITTPSIYNGNHEHVSVLEMEELADFDSYEMPEEIRKMFEEKEEEMRRMYEEKEKAKQNKK